MKQEKGKPEVKRYIPEGKIVASGKVPGGKSPVDNNVKVKEIIRLKDTYLSSYVNGTYFLERANMIVTQINNKKIIEKIDGCIKPVKFMIAEYGLNKSRARRAFKDMYEIQIEMKILGVESKEIDSMITGFYHENVMASVDYGTTIIKPNKRVVRRKVEHVQTKKK